MLFRSHRRHKRKAQKAALAAGVPIEHPPLERPEPPRLEESRLLQLAELVRRRFRR